MNTKVKRLINSGLLLTLMGSSSAALAQQYEDFYIVPYSGYSFATSKFELTNRDGVIERANLDESQHYGLQVGVNTPDPGNVYLLYSTQSTSLFNTVAGSEGKLIDVDVDYLHLGGSLMFPQGRFEPFVTVSIGATHLRPDNNLSSETYFSMGFGLGANYHLFDHLALTADIRGMGTFVNNDSDIFCDGNQCQWHIRSDIFWQAQANLGIKITF
ncbi:outer membrane beta-barrel protein [Shewanella marina]|uniref:outer membrane beta-barrel protein n=1 Tax=Shewanella marina TaxID=487319 RepID=UPI00046ED045|nr:outer membrane beta-barrel protein [Shewanella marina]